MVSIPEIQIPLSVLGSTPNASTHSTSIPLLGYGTASWPFGESEEIMKGSILTAIKLGYRHFDAASVYQSEQCLGEAISRALKLGLIESRGELFVTSKLWCSDVYPHRVLPALQDTLQKLGLEYLDLYLIHFPVEMSPLWQQKKLRKFCEEKGIHVTAYSPLGATGTLWGTNQVMECKILNEIAKAKGKTLAQVFEDEKGQCYQQEQQQQQH